MPHPRGNLFPPEVVGDPNLLAVNQVVVNQALQHLWAGAGAGRKRFRGPLPQRQARGSAVERAAQHGVVGRRNQDDTPADTQPPASSLCSPSLPCSLSGPGPRAPTSLTLCSTTPFLAASFSTSCARWGVQAAWAMGKAGPRMHGSARLHACDRGVLTSERPYARAGRRRAFSTNTSADSWKTSSTLSRFSSRDRPRFLLCAAGEGAPAQQHAFESAGALRAARRAAAGPLLPP